MFDNSPEISKTHLDNVLRQSSHFEISDNLKLGWSIFSKSVFRFILFVIILVAASLVGFSIPVIGNLATSLYIIPTLVAGISIYCYFIDYKNIDDFRQVTSQFKKFIPIITANLVVTVVSMLALLPISPHLEPMREAMQTTQVDPEIIVEIFQNIPKTTILLVIALYTLVNFLFMYVNYFIGLFDLNGIDSVLYSLRFTMKKFPILLIYFAIIFIIGFSGMLLFGIGVVFSFALVFPMIYASFKEITKYDDFYGAFLKEKSELQEELLS